MNKRQVKKAAKRDGAKGKAYSPAINKYLKRKIKQVLKSCGIPHVQAN